MSQPTVSVVIAAYNAVDHVERCVRSVAEQTVGPDALELIVVDDGSTDGTGPLLDVLATEFAFMQVWHQDNSGGPAAPRNRALDLVTAPYVFILDADDYLGPEALERLLAAARDNDADVVLGQMVGVGGRRPPQSMYKVNLPRADLFASRVYWTLNTMKLYRTSLLNDNGIRFDERLPWGENQPFVAAAYLEAEVISVVADYPCVHWVHREDGLDYTTRVDGLAARIPVVEAMFALVTSSLPPGPERDALLLRHFQREIADEILLRHVPRETDAQAVTNALALVRDLVDEHLTQRISDTLPPAHRVAIELARRGDAAALRELAPAAERFHGGAHAPAVVENGHAYLTLPFFRDQTRAIPDDFFELRDTLAAHASLEAIDFAGGMLHVAGSVAFSGGALPVEHAQLVLTQRTDGREISVDPVNGPAFDVALDLDTIDAGQRLPFGVWDLAVEAHCRGVRRRKRLGSARSVGVVPAPVATAVGHSAERTLAVAFFTQPYENLSVDMGLAKHQVVSVVNVHWEDAMRGRLEIVCDIAFPGLRATDARIVLTDDDGRRRTFRASSTAGTGTVSVRARMQRTLEGGPLPDGVWAGSLELELEGVACTVPFRMPERPRRVTWWRRGLPVSAGTTTGGRLRVRGFKRRVAGLMRRS